MRKLILLNLFISFLVISPRAQAKAQDPCEPFFDIEEVKKEDKDAHTALKRLKEAKAQVDEYQAFCAKAKADNTLANQDQMILADENQRDAVMVKNQNAKEAVKTAQESIKKAVDKMNDPQVKKRPGRDECGNSLIEDNDVLKKAKASLDAKAGGLASCVPPSSANSTESADSAQKNGFTAGSEKYPTDTQCRTSLFGCVKNSDGTFSKKIPL